MTGAKKPEVTLIQRQDTSSLKPLSHSHDGTIDEIDTAVGILLQHSGRAVHVL
jgi:hypothetical protein